MLERYRELCNYKEMIKSLVRKELRTRYKGSFLGFLWTFANPLLQLAVYSVIFPFILKFSQENYAMFLFVALIPWNFFTGSLQGSCGLIINNSNLVTKVYFPREVLPLSYTLSGLCNLCFGYMVVVPMLLLFGIPLTWNILWLPVLFVTQAVLCAGISLLVSSINVYFRDVEYLIGIALMALYFLTPIMYDITSLPEQLRPIVMLNPMAGFSMSYREVMYHGRGLSLSLFAYPLCFSVVCFIVGLLVFNRLQRDFTEVL